MAAIPTKAWRKSSYSGGGQPNCVEVAHAGPTVAVRDTKNRETGMLQVSRRAWSTFVSSLPPR